MGFDRDFSFESRSVLLEFDGPFEGLQIRAGLDLPALRQLQIMKQLQKLQAITETGDEEQAEAALREAMELFVTVTDGWNWKVNNEPLPLTADSLLNVIPGNLAFSLVNKWSETVRGVDAPLAEESSSDETSPENPTPTPENESQESTN